MIFWPLVCQQLVPLKHGLDGRDSLPSVCFWIRHCSPHKRQEGKSGERVATRFKASSRKKSTIAVLI